VAVARRGMASSHLVVLSTIVRRYAKPSWDTGSGPTRSIWRWVNRCSGVGIGWTSAVCCCVTLAAWHAVQSLHQACQDMDSLVCRNYILLINPLLYICELSWALDWPLLVYIACDILLGLFLCKYLFLKWQYSSIGPQIMTNFVKIDTIISSIRGKLIHSSNWLLILRHFAHQSSSWNLKLQLAEIIKVGKPQSRRQKAGFIYKLQFLKICLKKSILKSIMAILL
jgi:hypothetical protein